MQRVIDDGVARELLTTAELEAKARATFKPELIKRRLVNLPGPDGSVKRYEAIAYVCDRHGHAVERPMLEVFGGPIEATPLDPRTHHVEILWHLAAIDEPPGR